MIAGTYIVTGATMREPIVALLDAWQCANLADGVRLAMKRDSEKMLLAVYAQAFGPGAEYCYPASPAMLGHIVSDDFTSPHRDAVRCLAARLLLGEPILPPGAGPQDGGGGGTPARLIPEAPQSPPGGERAALVF